MIWKQNDKSRQWKSVSLPRPKKDGMQHSLVKVMLITFFDHQGMVHHQFVPHWQTVNVVPHWQTLRCCITTMLLPTQPST